MGVNSIVIGLGEVFYEGEKALRVMVLDTGRAEWVPHKYIQDGGRMAIVPRWLYRKFLQNKKRGNHEIDGGSGGRVPGKSN